MKNKLFLGIITIIFALIACNAVFAENATDNSTSTNVSSTDSNQDSNGVSEAALNIVISGNVTRCNNGNPFEGVTVTVTENGTPVANTTTDENGKYILNFLSNSHVFTVTASYPGHVSSSTNVSVSTGEDNTLPGAANFELGQPTVFVDPKDGKDTNSGDLTHPYKTLEKAINEVNENGIINLINNDNTVFAGTGNVNLLIGKSLIIQAWTDYVTIDGAGTWIFDIENSTKFINVTIMGLNMINGYSSKNGGAIYFRSYHDDILNLRACDFNNNLADGQSGGAIFTNRGRVYITNCNFTKNRATRGMDGGAIYTYQSTVVVTSCNFNGNTANNGGAIWGEGGMLTVNDSTFTDNNATQSNNYEKSGGAIGAICHLDVNRCTFNSNNAVCDGSAIWCSDISNIVNSTFTSNVAESGAVWNWGTSTITGCNFEYNKASNRGGAIENYGFMVIDKSFFNYNEITGTGGAGGAISYLGKNLTITNTYFTGNLAPMGGVIWTGQNSRGSDGPFNITSCVFIDNFAAQSNSPGLGSVLYNDRVSSGNFNFNRIYNNHGINELYSIAGNVNAENNWWGTNFDTGDPVTAGYVGSERVDANPWIVLKVTANPTSILYGQTTKISADFTHNNLGEIVSGIIPAGDVILKNVWGSFDNTNPLTHSFKGTTVNGVLNATFYAIDSTDTLTSPVCITATSCDFIGLMQYLDYTTSGVYSAFINIEPVVLTISELGNTTVFAGQALNYTITLTNQGPLSAANVAFKVNLTGINAYNTGTLQYQWKLNDNVWSGWTSYDFTTPLILNLGNLQKDDVITLQINGTINASTPGGSVITSNARVNTTTTTGEKTASLQTTVNTLSNLVVTQTGSADAYAGTDITYTINVTNNGPSDAQNVQVQDSIPSILDSVTHDPFDLGIIPAGESRTIHITGKIPSNTLKGTIIQNTPTAISDNGPLAISPIISTYVDTLADVDLNTIVDKLRPDVGNIVTFIVTAHNYGPSDATNIQIKDIMPSYFTNVNISPSKGTYDNGTGIWTLNLTSGEEATLNLTGIVSTIIAGKNTTNNATKISQSQADPDTFDASNATIYVPQSDLSIQITSDKKNPTVGEIFTLTYKLGNNGPDDATNVTITIPLPEGFHISSINGDGTWTIVGNNIIWTFNNVTVGDPYLFISGWTTAAGEYIYTASINSNTFNINTRGVNSLSINAKPQVNAATINTVGMQKTGVPLAGIILSILLVLGGFISTHEKQ